MKRRALAGLPDHEGVAAARVDHDPRTVPAQRPVDALQQARLGAAIRAGRRHDGLRSSGDSGGRSAGRTSSTASSPPPNSGHAPAVVALGAVPLVEAAHLLGVALVRLVEAVIAHRELRQHPHGIELLVAVAALDLGLGAVDHEALVVARALPDLVGQQQRAVGRQGVLNRTGNLVTFSSSSLIKLPALAKAVADHARGGPTEHVLQDRRGPHDDAIVVEHNSRVEVRRVDDDHRVTACQA